MGGNAARDRPGAAGVDRDQRPRSRRAGHLLAVGRALREAALPGHRGQRGTGRGPGGAAVLRRPGPPHRTGPGRGAGPATTRDGRRGRQLHRLPPAAAPPRPARRVAMTGASTIRIGLLLPDVLGTYADTGNAAVLAARARWRGIPTEIVTITADATPPAGCDVYLLGGGEDTAQLFAADWLRRHRDLHHALDSSARVLAVCAGLQILGHTMRDRASQDHPGLGILDLTTTPGRRRAVGEITTACAIPDVGQLTGFENHHGITTLGTGTAPLGTVITGTGNGTRDNTGRPAEGVRTDRVIGTYLHGPVLARNPALADHLLTAITGTEMAPLELPDQAALRRAYFSPRVARGVIRHRYRIPQEPHSPRQTFT